MQGRLIRTALLLGAAAYVTARESGMFHPGNDRKYDPASTPCQPDDGLAGKRIIWLGSSLTAGRKAQNTGLPAYMEAMYRTVTAADLSVAGSPLTDIVQNSGIARLRSLAKDLHEADLLVCELDEACFRDRGELTASADRFACDLSTGFGAVQYVISFTREMFHCPVFFWASFWDPSGTFGDTVSAVCENGTGFCRLEDLLPAPAEADEICFFSSSELTKAGIRGLLAPAMYRQLDQRYGGKR